MTAHSPGDDARPATFFDEPDQFRAWLETNHASAHEIWVGLRKAHVTPRGLTWAAAVAEALCFGWIDSVMQPIGPDAVRQRFTPRRRNSRWSRVNIDVVGRLVDEGRMTPAGLAAFERRDVSRDPPPRGATPRLPPEYLDRLRADEAAAAFFFGRATPAYRRTCADWVRDAKREATRQRRMDRLVADCAAGRIIALLRYGPPPVWAKVEPTELPKPPV
ncbi:MAG TPA: YdeI/OmpD-associated family protein [Dermatophilaceae bacterium]|nr:YdeI/OmpD-associated family protein [Dermatophilaceae bacterium]